MTKSEITRTTLGQLSDEELSLHVAWEATGEVEDGDKVLIPATTDHVGRVASTVGEVWCRSVCCFLNGEQHPACAMYRGDGPEGPLAWSVTNNDGEEVRLIVPPAPPVVLEIDGPIAFARNFGHKVEEIFP